TTAREVEQTPQGLRAIPNRLSDYFQTLLVWFIGAAAHQEQLRPPLNHCQRIIEVVRDTRGEFAQRAQLIGSRGAFLGQLAFGDVAHENHYSGDAAVTPERRGMSIHAANAAVGTDRAHFELFL